MPADVRGLLNDSLQQIQYFISPYGASQFVSMIKSMYACNENDHSLQCLLTSMIDCLDEIQHRPPQAPATDICCAAAGADVLTPPAAPIVTETVSETGSSSFYGKVK